MDFYEIPYPINLNEDLGIFLFHLLRRRKFKSDKYFSMEGMSDSIELTISDSYCFRKGARYLDDYQAYLLNKYLEKRMMNHCITWIMGAEMAGMNNKAAIIKWIGRYELDSGSLDWYARIQKNYFRYRKAKESRKTSVLSVH